MSLGEQLKAFFRPAAYLGTNPITLAGAVLTTSSAITLVIFWIFSVFLGGSVNPYLGLLLFLILPGVFVFGLVLIPVGAFGSGTSLCRPEKYQRSTRDSISPAASFVTRSVGSQDSPS